MKKTGSLRGFALLGAFTTALLVSMLAVSAAPASSVVGMLTFEQRREKETTFIKTPKPDARDLTTEAQIARGLAHLASLQDKETGAWKGDVGLKYGVDHGAYQVDAHNVPHIGITALACMALVAGGSTPRSGPYAANIQRGTKYLLSNVKQGGQIVDNGTRMYSNAFAALYLAEIYGMYGGDEIAAKLREAIAFIEKNQGSDGESKGGWRYVPKQNDADISVTVCLLQALRAARNAGISVHQSTIDAARDYIVRNYDSRSGGFTYQPSKSYGRESFALTAAGIVSLQSAGEYRSFKLGDDAINFRSSIGYLRSHRPDADTAISRRMADYSFWYGHYYAAQAMRQWGVVAPREWEEWNAKNRRNFGAIQDSETGAWLDEIGNYRPEEAAYATAMACLILSIPNNYLPIFQN